MCLLSNNKPRKARKDITCYKVIRIDENKDKAPLFQTTKGSYKDWPVLKPEKECNPTCIETHHGDSYEYGPGFIHAFKTLKRAKDEDSFVKMESVNTEVWACIIPKGVEFAEGVNKDICAKSMIAIQLIDIHKE